jgi:hypothetical protein
MEVALMTPFLPSETLSSSLTNIDSGFLSREVYSLKTAIGLSIDEIYTIPTYMRREFLNFKMRENEVEKARYEGLR